MPRGGLREITQRKIIRIDLITHEITSWPSVRSAARAINSNPGDIARVLNGNRQTHKNFKFEYA